jgi:hypothetical protein
MRIANDHTAVSAHRGTECVLPSIQSTQIDHAGARCPSEHSSVAAGAVEGISHNNSPVPAYAGSNGVTATIQPAEIGNADGLTQAG